MNVTEPVFHTSTNIVAGGARTEWHLPNNLNIRSNLRLINVEPVMNVGNSFLLNAGVYGLISRMTLYSNDQVVCSLRDVAKYMAFKNLSGANAHHLDMKHPTIHSNIGVQYKEPNNKLNVTLDGVLLPDSNGSNNRIEVNQVLSYLQANEVLSGFDNLRLVVEWNADLKEMVVYRDAPNTTTTITMLTPQLVYETSTKAGQNKTTYFAVENDRLYINSIAVENDTQTTNQRINAYNNKIVKRILLVNYPLEENNSSVLRNLQSIAQSNEKITFTLNGRSLLPYGGLDNEAKKQAMLTEAYGDHITPLGSNWSAFENQDEIVEEDFLEQIYGGMSYGAVNIGERNEEFNVQYVRKGLGADEDGVFRQQLHLYVFAEVVKYVNQSNGKISTGYA